ncbi:MAG: choice-of-anchor D domain-containing protein, partial [Deltaproteobacteria bacterium]
MRRCALHLLFSCAAFAALAGCQDEGGGLQQTVPLADTYRVSDTDEIPEQPEYADVSSEGVISVNFGRVVVASLSTRYLFIRNGGRAGLKFYGLERLGDSSSVFQVGCRSGALFATPCEVSEQQPVTVPAGGELGLRLDFVPVDTTSYSAVYMLRTNAEDHPTLRLELSGTGVSPDLQVCITDCTGDEQSQQCAGANELCSDSAGAEGLSITFGDAELGQAIRRKVVIRNRGDEALNIGNLGITSGDYNQFGLDLNGNSLPGTLGAGDEAVLWVEYSPSVGGEHESLLAVGSNDPDTPTVIVGLQGRGMAPRLCPEPLSLDFGNVPTGESKAMSFDVTNCGLLDLELSAVQFSAQTQTQDFVLAEVPQLPLVLAPGEGTSITVEYRPAERGSDHGGVDLYSNDPASDPQTGFTGTIALRGQSTPRECDLVATPYAVNFGGVVQAGTRQEQLILTNMGTDSCTVERAEITENSPDGEFAIDEAPVLPAELLPGD